MSRFPTDHGKLTWLLIAITTIFRLYLAGSTGLGVGESYYWRGTQFLDWSYFDQPPLFFWISAFTTWLLGLSNFALRLPAVLFFAGTCSLMYLVAKRLFNSAAGFYSVLLINISFVFTLPIAAWFQPDAPLLFFWMLTTYCLVRLFFAEAQSQSLQWWILAGISLGLTTLSKYHAIFLMAGTFIFVVTNKDMRHWLTKPGPYLAILICIVFLTPVFYWNAQHEWVSFNFQGSRAGGYEVDFSRLARSLLGQVMWLAPWIWLPLMRQMYISGRSSLIDKRQSFLFWTSVLPIAFFTLIAPFARIGFHFHWQAPGYMMLFIPLGAVVAERMTNGRKSTKKWLWGSAVVTSVVTVVLLIHMTTGFWAAWGPKLVGEKFGSTTDPTLEGVDFVDIRDRFIKEGWLDDPNLFVASEKWWQTGKIDWPLKGQKPILIFHPDPRNHAYYFDPIEFLGKDAIYIRHKKKPKPPSGNVTPFFQEIIPQEDLAIRRFGKTELLLEVFYCKGFQIPEVPQDHLPVYRRLLGKEPF